MAGTTTSTSVMRAESLRAAFVRVFVGSVAVNAVLGIWALLSSDFGQTQGKVLLTSFLHSASEGVAIGVGFGSGELQLGLLIALVLLLTAMLLARRLDRLVLAPLRDLADATDRWGLDDWPWCS